MVLYNLSIDLESYFFLGVVIYDLLFDLLNYFLGGVIVVLIWACNGFFINFISYYYWSFTIIPFKDFVI